MLPEQTIEFRYDTQLLIEGEDLDEDAINEYFTENFKIRLHCLHTFQNRTLSGSILRRRAFGEHS